MHLLVYIRLHVFHYPKFAIRMQPVLTLLETNGQGLTHPSLINFSTAYQNGRYKTDLNLFFRFLSALINSSRKRISRWESLSSSVHYRFLSHWDIVIKPGLMFFAGLTRVYGYGVLLNWPNARLGWKYITRSGERWFRDVMMDEVWMNYGRWISVVNGAPTRRNQWERIYGFFFTNKNDGVNLLFFKMNF